MKETRTIEQGFTLLELIIVLLIAGLLVSLAGVRLSGGLRSFREREFLQEFVSTLRQARLSALRSGQGEDFRINGQDRSFGLTGQVDKAIPENAAILTEGMIQDPLTGDFLTHFFADGSPTVRAIRIRFDTGRVFDVRLDPLFGTVTWDRENPS